jgi:flavin reductase (DIM6/NTAB) family NADH-FMN oxidoreductase RutF
MKFSEMSYKKEEIMKREMSNVTRLLPCSVVLLSVGNGKKKDAMTATSMFVSEDPPLFVVSVDRGHLTHALIEETGQFVLNVASVGQAKLARGIGSTHGDKVDKFKKFAIETEKAKGVSAPIIKGSFASIECNVLTSFPVSTYTVYLASAEDFKVNEALTPLVWHFNRFYGVKNEVK